MTVNIVIFCDNYGSVCSINTFVYSIRSLKHCLFLLIAFIDTFILTCVFRSKRRLLTVYNANDQLASLQTVELDTTPSVLTLFYDADSATLFVTGKVRF